MREIVEEAETAKVKRSMYAETQREKSAILEAVRNSEWNAEMNPLMIAFSEGQVIEHDFSKGWVLSVLPCESGLTITFLPRPCHVPVSAVIKNCSLTHTSRYKLKLASRADVSYPPE